MNAVAMGWLSANADKFSQQDYEVIKAKLEKADEAVAARVAGTQLKDPGTAFIITLLLGCFGSLYVGDMGGFWLRFFTGNGCFVLWIKDLCGGIKDAARKANAAKVIPYI